MDKNIKLVIFFLKIHSMINTDAGKYGRLESYDDRY